MNLAILCVFLGLSLTSFAQGPVITPLKGNSALKRNSVSGSPKRALGDTLQLPILDDFSTSGPGTDAKYWLDAQVYVNNHFAVSPPSYGVATFDNLDYRGRPYQALSGLTHNHCDSLTSRWINLKDYKNGVNTVNYTLADSIYLSFFYQTQGLGDVLDGSDSLVLKFKNTDGLWKTVWKTTGSSLKPFKQVLIAVNRSEYLIPGFQFRFINYGKSTGNMNQWHLDYIRMKSGRSSSDTVIQDVAINAVPVGPLQWYESMPYSHFLANPAFHSSQEHRMALRNNYNTGVLVRFKCDVRNQYNQLVKTYPLSSSARNISAQSDSSEAYTRFDFDTFSSQNPELRLEYTIAPLSNDFLPSLYNNAGNNNVLTKTVKFRNYFAYDDGSAEGGYGLDYGSLPAGPGYAAIKFNTSKPDTLRGISVFFNRSAADAEFKAFTLMVWKQISEPPANNTAADVILKRIDIPSAVYTDSLNGFTDIIFDTSVYLPQGSFYIGWQQNTKFILNVGYDNNYQYAKTGGRNPNLFFNLNGYWEKVSSTITGAVMMRPLVGDRIKRNDPVALRNPQILPSAELYPNPGNGNVRIESPRRIVKATVYSLSGVKLIGLEGEQILEIDTDALESGLYIIELSDENGYSSTHKWIKQS